LSTLMFKILVPLWNWFDIEELINLWADEFYFWIDFTIWLNKRDNPKAQISLEEVKRVFDIKRKYTNIKFFITLNEAPINISQDEIYKLLQRLLSLINPDAFIVRDLYLIKVLRQIKPDVKIHLSSLSQIWNRLALDYFFEILWDSFERLIFPRDITWIEIYEIIRNYPNLEYEIFAINERCWNVDGLCSSLHYSGKKIWVPFICYREYSYNWPEDLKQIIFNRTSCKVCGFWRFKDIDSVISLKIVWRWATYEQIKRNVIFLRKILDFIELAENEIEYKNFCKFSLNRINRVNRCQHCEFNV